MERGLPRVAAFGAALNRGIECLCAALMAALVLVVGFEVLQRYVLKLGLTWGEECSRYLMIWAALLAVPVGAYRREHVGLEFVQRALPARVARALRLGLDLVGVAFFLFLAVYGVGMAAAGATQYATVFGMTMVVPFASVPACGALTSVQILVTMLRDREAPSPARGAA